MLMAEADAVLV